METMNWDDVVVLAKETVEHHIHPLLDKLDDIKEYVEAIFADASPDLSVCAACSNPEIKDSVERVVVAKIAELDSSLDRPANEPSVDRIVDATMAYVVPDLSSDIDDESRIQRVKDAIIQAEVAEIGPSVALSKVIGGKDLTIRRGEHSLDPDVVKNIRETVATVIHWMHARPCEVLITA